MGVTGFQTSLNVQCSKYQIGQPAPGNAKDLLTKHLTLHTACFLAFNISTQNRALSMHFHLLLDAVNVPEMTVICSVK